MEFDLKCLKYKETIEIALGIHKNNRPRVAFTEDIAAMFWAMLTIITGLNGGLRSVADEKGAEKSADMVVKTCEDIINHVTKMRSH